MRINRSARSTKLLLNWICCVLQSSAYTVDRQVMPDDHSELVPPLPIPNRTVKRLCANDSAATSVKVGYRQAVIPKNPAIILAGFFYAHSFRKQCV